MYFDLLESIELLVMQVGARVPQTGNFGQKVLVLASCAAEEPLARPQIATFCQVRSKVCAASGVPVVVARASYTKGAN